MFDQNIGNIGKWRHDAKKCLQNIGKNIGKTSAKHRQYNKNATKPPQNNFLIMVLTFDFFSKVSGVFFYSIERYVTWINKISAQVVKALLSRIERLANTFENFVPVSIFAICNLAFAGVDDKID